MSILAKSTGIYGEKRLDKHIEDDLIAFESMFGTREQPSRLARQWLRFFGLGPGAFYRLLDKRYSGNRAA